MHLALKAPSVPASPIHHIMSSSAIRESAGERARKRTCFPPSIEVAPPKDLLPSLKEAGSLEGGGQGPDILRDRLMWLQFLSHRVGRTALQGACVWTGERVCAERNANPASVQHSSESIPSLLR